MIPRKAAFILEELGLTYESVFLDFGKGEQKAPSHTQYNPNGRIPTLIDHTNGDFAVWESNAIMLYLVDKYDKEKKLALTDGKEEEKYQLVQWLFSQASGQGYVIPSSSGIPLLTVPTSQPPPPRHAARTSDRPCGS